MNEIVKKAVDHFVGVVEEQLERVARLKAQQKRLDLASQRPLRIAFAGGDGIGPIISEETKRLLEQLLRKEIESGAVELRTIEGLTIENRFKVMQAVPDAVSVLQPFAR